MIRRGVSLLLIAGFLASQLAAIPHAYEATTEENQRKHDATPHFHGAWLGHAAHDHDDDHDHSPGAKGHSHSGREQKGSLRRSDENSSGHPAITCVVGTSHDADAIFVSERVVAASRSRVQVVSTWPFAALATFPGCLADSLSSPAPSPRWHPPDKVLDASDTYLTLRNLRI